MHTLVDSGVNIDLNLNSDHRAIYCKIKICKNVIQRWRRKSFATTSSATRWWPEDGVEYGRSDEKICDIKCEESLKDKSTSLEKEIDALEDALRTTAKICKAANQTKTSGVLIEIQAAFAR